MQVQNITTFPSSRTRANPNQTTTTLYLVLLVPLHALPSLPYCYCELDVCVSIEIRESTFVLHEGSSHMVSHDLISVGVLVLIHGLILYFTYQARLHWPQVSTPIPHVRFFPFRVMHCFTGV